jgi:hypothetical protein
MFSLGANKLRVYELRTFSYNCPSIYGWEESFEPHPGLEG